MKRTISISLILIVSSLSSIAQKAFDKELTIGFGNTRSYNKLIQDADHFDVKGVNMMRAFGNWEFKKIGKIKLGAGFEFYNTRYQYLDRYKPDINTPNRVGLYFHSGGSVNVIALSLSTRYEIYGNRYYKLYAKLSPKLGYVVYGYYLGKKETLYDGMYSVNEDFFIERPGKWYSKSIFPLVAFEIENEIKLSKRSGIVVTTGYQQGFKTYFKNPMQFYRNYQTLNETIEPFTVQNKGNMLFYQISYRHYF